MNLITLFWVLQVVLCSSGLAQKPSESILPVEIKGNQLYTGHNQFFIKGIAYQPERPSGAIYSRLYETSYIDPLANYSVCERDIENFEVLGVNLVRVYQIDPSKNHDKCMDALASKKIYVLLDLAEPELSIERTHPGWTTELLDRYTSVVDAMAKYKNVLGFLAGNEVTLSKSTTGASPFVKAAIRDVKRYISLHNYRQIPVGYATNDDADTRLPLSEYFANCEGEKDAGADFLGINMYEWCGHSTFATSGYRDRTIEYSNYPIPTFFSEFGCNAVENGRPFTEIDAIYSSAMTGVWSGGVAYLYFEYENHYGVVKELSNGTVAKLRDFSTLLQKFNGVNPDINPFSERPRKIACPPTSDKWKASCSIPPTPNSHRCECMQTTYDCILSPQRDDKDLNGLLKELCADVDCSEIEADGIEGTYGSLSGCSLKQRVSFALNKYYHYNGRDEELCDFGGNAILVQGNRNLSQIFIENGKSCEHVLGNITHGWNAPVSRTDTIEEADSGLTEFIQFPYESGTSKKEMFGSLCLVLLVSTIWKLR